MNDISKEQPDLLNVSELFAEDTYTIPIYQRNYAWGPSEVEQLLRDILDMSGGTDNDAYYLGSLVVHRRAETTASEKRYETIDGQQRHTTLSIILAVLKQNYATLLDGPHKIESTNLRFDSRPKSTRTLAMLFESGEYHAETGEPTMYAAYNVVLQFMEGLTLEDQKRFVTYLLTNVKVLRTVVPPETDLNHYFEIMNNRGEQLEKHEVLKARLMGALDPEDQGGFAKIWDACAEMDRYVVMCFDKEHREPLFGEDWVTVEADFTHITATLALPLAENPQCLSELIKHKGYKKEVKDQREDDSAFRSIVNFPNFLLHVLRLQTGADSSLDDKAFLVTFDKYLPHTKENRGQIKTFAALLLKTRLLFDRYIIKRKNDEKWSLKRFAPTDSSASYNELNSFREVNQNQQLIMLLSMFHVSYPAQPRKHWLSATLKYLHKASTDVTAEGYIKHLEHLSDQFFFGRFYTATPADYDELPLVPDASTVGEQDSLSERCLHKGTATQNFIFNRLDYLIWKCAKDKQESELGEGLGKIDWNELKNFQFSFRSSVEHYYPQRPVDGEPLAAPESTPNLIDHFGNLCLISSSQNSKLSNLMPESKKGILRKKSRKGFKSESLKQALMMRYKQWSAGEIAEHGEKMITLLCSVSLTKL